MIRSRFINISYREEYKTFLSSSKVIGSLSSYLYRESAGPQSLKTEDLITKAKNLYEDLIVLEKSEDGKLGTLFITTQERVAYGIDYRFYES